MSNLLRRNVILVSSLALAVTAGNAVAGGFEKATIWDAKYRVLVYIKQVVLQQYMKM